MKTILISPDSSLLNNRIFANTQNDIYQDNQSAFLQLKKRLYEYGYELNTIDMGNSETADRIIIFDIPPQNYPNFTTFHECVKRGLQEKMIGLIIESPVVYPQSWNPQFHEYFTKVLTWNDDLIDNKKYFKLSYPQGYIKPIPFIPFANRKLLTLVAGNKHFQHPLELYSERINAIRSLERICPYDFDLYGRGWNRPNSRIQNQATFLVPRYPSYRGEITNKYIVVSKYKFCICYENMLGVPGYSGYITEKLHDCFMSDCVPVYLGANNILKYVPENTYIDRRKFSSYEELYAYLVRMPEAEFYNYISAIRQYLKSELFAKNFSVETFVNLFVSHLVAS